MLYAAADANAADRHTMQYFDMFGNRAISDDGWLARAVQVRAADVPSIRLSLVAVFLVPGRNPVVELFQNGIDLKQLRGEVRMR